MIDVITWWLTILAVGLAALPIANTLGAKNDSGYAISKPLGILLITYLTWATASFLPVYGRTLIFLTLALMATVSAYLLYKKGFEIDPWEAVRVEALFTVAFLIFVGLRAYSPEIYFTYGEKFMDHGFTATILRSNMFPTVDPWYAGEPMQYYYMGYVVIANLILLSGTPTTIAFNLSIPTLFAISLTTAYIIGKELTSSRRFGLLTGFLVAVAGNLLGFFQLFVMNGGLLHRLNTFNYWSSSRIIPDTINEFPFFSFLHADMHAHTISIPFQLLYIALLLVLYRAPRPRPIHGLTMAVGLGLFYPLNTWEYPTYALLTLGVVITRILDDRENLKSWAVFGAGTMGLSLLLYAPYLLSYSVPHELGFVTTRTELIRFLTIYGLPLFLILSLLSREYLPHIQRQAGLMGLGAIAILVASSIMLSFETLVILLPLVGLGLLGIFQDNNDRRFALLLATMGGFVALGCEVIYIKDGMGAANPDWERMNTVFKFYLQVWVLWAIAAGYAAWEFREYLSRNFTRNSAWAAVFVLLLLLVSVYPVAASFGRSGGFQSEPTLDGMVYVAKEHPYDYEAIQFLSDLPGLPVVVQAPGETYQWSTYVTCLTGLPTPIGWAGHEVNWRMDGGEVSERMNDVKKIFTATSNNERRGLIEKYDVEYVYVGPVELENYGDRIADRFWDSPDFEAVFVNEEVVIFKVKEQ